MSTMDEERTGALFPNENKRSNKHPDMEGFITIRGERWRIAAWDNVGKTSGKPYKRLKAETQAEYDARRNEAQGNQPANTPQPPPPPSDPPANFEDDVPF